MFGGYVLHTQPFRFFRGHVQDALAFRAKRNFHRSGDAFANRDPRFDLLADGFNRALLPQKTIGESFVFAHQAKQEVFGLDVWTSVLAGFIPRKKDYATRLFRVAFKHVSSFLPVGPCSLKTAPAETR